MKIKRTLVFVLLLSLVLASCAADTGEAEDGSDVSHDSAYTISFTDDLGREVTVNSPERVAVMIGSFADIWCLAGGKDSIVAAANDIWTEFDLGLSDDVVNLGSIKSPDMEALISSEPDLVIASTNTSANVEMLDTLESMGINVIYFGVSSFDEYLHMLDICSQITGCPENYQEYGENVKEQVDAAVARVTGEAPTVLYVRATGSSVKVKNSKDSVLGEMLFDLGCVNIADSDESLLEELSLEAILTADPDYIFVVIQGSDPTDAEKNLDATLLSNPAWNQLTAVQEGRYYVLDNNLYNLKPNARWGEAYEKLADIIYP
ncbi:MAG: ABC transporter substrate-binding protein [Oscillospiraceae bacterium]